jgi:hypothetical protein
MADIKPNFQYIGPHNGTPQGLAKTQAEAFAILTHYCRRHVAHVHSVVANDTQFRIRWYIDYRPAMHQCLRADHNFTFLKPQATYDEPLAEPTPQAEPEVLDEPFDSSTMIDARPKRGRPRKE